MRQRQGTGVMPSQTKEQPGLPGAGRGIGLVLSWEPYCAVGECKLIGPLWRMVWRVLKKPGINPPYDPAIPLVGIHLLETSN